MSAMTAMYVNLNRANTQMAKANNVIESGRLAVEVLAEDIAHAGFWGGYIPIFDDLTTALVPTDVPTASPDPCLVYNTNNWTPAFKSNLVGLPIQVFGDTPTGCANLLTNKQTNTDVVVVRRASNCAVGNTNCEPLDASKVYFQASLCDTEVAAGNLYSLSATDATLKLRNCTTVAPRRKYFSNIYYIRNYASTTGDGIPTLMRSRLDLVSSAPAQEVPVALIEGIQGFAVELGLDATSRCNTPANYTSAPIKVDPSTCTVNTVNADFNTAPTNRGDGVPEAPFVKCTGATGCTAGQLMNATAAKIYVLARSREATAGDTDAKTYSLGSTTLGPFNDGFKRHVFQLTVRINNVAARRETP